MKAIKKRRFADTKCLEFLKEISSVGNRATSEKNVFLKFLLLPIFAMLNTSDTPVMLGNVVFYASC